MVSYTYSRLIREAMKIRKYLVLMILVKTNQNSIARFRNGFSSILLKTSRLTHLIDYDLVSHDYDSWLYIKL